MNNIQANPVETIKKDIYIIKNKINNKIYVGQSKNAKIRFKQHCKLSNMNNSEIGKAISEYGKENFSLEIIEHQITNYNEREKYWIKYYNSIIPFGYNVQEGGEKPPTLYGEDSPACVLSDEKLIELKKDLANTKLSYLKLADKYNISKRQILRINYGLSRANINEKYPIRKKANINGKLSDTDIKVIVELLKHTYFFNGEIARMFNVEVHAISDINTGKTHKIKDEIYPIRKWKSCGVIKFTYQQVTEIIMLLKNTKMSLNQIAKKYNVKVHSIQEINNGFSKKYRRDEIIYPIRDY